MGAMTVWFPDAPPSSDLTPTQALLLGGFRRVLEEVQPTRTRPDLTSARLGERRPEFDLDLKHDSRADFGIGVSLFEDEEVMAYWGELAHDDFQVSSYSSPDEAVADALGFVEQALTGRFEVDATFRGDLMTKETTFWIGDDRERQPIGTTGRLLFNPFRRPRHETIRVSFIDG